MTRLTRQDFYEIIKHGIEGDKPQFQETLYYLRFFDQLGDRTRFIRWNWAAFLEMEPGCFIDVCLPLECLFS